MIKNSRYECFIDYNSLNGKINDVENKMQNTSNLETTTVLNTKISEVENKNPNLDTCITTREFNKSIAKKIYSKIRTT